MRRFTSFAVLAASHLLICSASADAQRYYARQTLAGISKSPSAYEGSWSDPISTSSACAGGFKTVTTASSCTVSGNAAPEAKCDPASKPAPSSVPVACTLSCGTMESGYYQGPGGVSSGLLGIASSAQDALRLCKAYSSEKGVCATNNSNFQTYYYVGATYRNEIGYSHFAAVCRSI